MNLTLITHLIAAAVAAAGAWFYQGAQMDAAETNRILGRIDLCFPGPGSLSPFRALPRGPLRRNRFLNRAR